MGASTLRECSAPRSRRRRNQIAANAPAFAAKNFGELFGSSVIDPYFIGDSAQEGFVGTIGGIEIGGEGDENVERDFKFFCALQREEIDAAIQRSHPAIEQFVGAEFLAAEIVDDQDAVIGFHLQRGGVGVGGFVVLEIEHVGGEFTASENAGAAAEHPAAVGVFGDGILRLPMRARIEDLMI